MLPELKKAMVDDYMAIKQTIELGSSVGQADHRPDCIDLRDTKSAETNTDDPCLLLWPNSALKQLTIHARIDKIAAQYKRIDCKTQQRNLAIEYNVLSVFEQKKFLDPVEDICIPIEQQFGIPDIHDATAENPVDQAKIQECYDLIARICHNIMDDLGYVESSTGSWTVRAPL